MNRYVLAQREAATAKRHRQLESLVVWTVIGTFLASAAGVLGLLVWGLVRSVWR